MHGFQLWANLPASLKMTDPRYQDIHSNDIPEVTDDDGTRVRVIIGEFWGKRGPVEGIAGDPRYLDVWVPPGKRKTIPVELGRHAFAYVFEGSGTFRDASAPQGVMTERTDGSDIVESRRAGRRADRHRCGACPSISIAATKSPCRPANTASASCSRQAARSKNPSPGTGRS